MHTLSYILKVTRLEDRVGEARPGFLHDEKANLGGQAQACKGKVLVKRSRTTCSRKKGKAEVIRLDYQIDKKMGDLRIVRINTCRGK